MFDPLLRRKTWEAKGRSITLARAEAVITNRDKKIVAKSYANFMKTPLNQKNNSKAGT